MGMAQQTSFVLLLTAICLFWGQTNAQLLKGTNGSAVPIWALSDKIQGGASTLCNKTFADANATGLFSMNPNVVQGPQTGQPDNRSGRTLDSLVAVTIENPGFSNTSNSSASYTLWYNPNGANYSNDFSLGYDVCVIAGLSLNYNTQLRGQKDDGSCSATLDTPCINAINARAAQYANWLTTPSPGPNSNLTNTSLPGICRTLATEISQNIPTECSYFFQDNTAAIGWPLTSYGGLYETALFPSCMLNGTYYNTVGFFNNASQAVYDAWYQAVTPVIGVWMPVAGNGANVGSTISIANSVAEIFCGHTNTVNKGSYTPAAAPSPTAVKYNTTSNANNSTTNGTTSGITQNDKSSGSLSGGAKAGIAVGVIVGVLGIGGLVLGLLWRRRKTKKAAEGHEQIAEVEGKDARFELNDDSGIKQLPATPGEGGKEAKGPVGELEGGGNVAEVEGDKGQGRGELAGHPVQAPVELPGSSPPGTDVKQ